MRKEQWMVEQEPISWHGTKRTTKPTWRSNPTTNIAKESNRKI